MQRKGFPGVIALNNISLHINPGKSTLMKILSGVYEPTEGKIIINGKIFDRLTLSDSYEL